MWTTTHSIRFDKFSNETPPVAVINVVPVFDILDGQVVRGAGGDRSTYRPVKLPVKLPAADTTLAIAEHLYEAASQSPACYVADLDALQGGLLQIEPIETIASLPWEVWLDAGIGDVTQYDRHRQRIEAGVDRWIVALESLRSTTALCQLGDALGEHGVFSIDLVGGRLRTTIDQWQDASVSEIAEQALDAGFRWLIVLDVQQVGMRTGNQLGETLSNIRDSWPQVELISGGGIRDRNDLLELQQNGCHHALVATALYDGKI
jgi:phosphoribosylformimino-5-aminoimidazole carboxamide ribotide isomerase